MEEKNRKEANDAYRPAKRAWQSPELTEADYVLTEASYSGIGADAGSYS